MISRFLEEKYESDLINYLKNIYLSRAEVSESDKVEMREYETEDYALLGIIGLILNNKPRILLGKKQPYDQVIQQKCSEVTVSHRDLEEMAEKYLDDDFRDESEFILRKVMLEYPNDIEGQ